MPSIKQQIDELLTLARENGLDDAVEAIEHAYRRVGKRPVYTKEPAWYPSSSLNHGAVYKRLIGRGPNVEVLGSVFRDGYEWTAYINGWVCYAWFDTKTEAKAYVEACLRVIGMQPPDEV